MDSLSQQSVLSAWSSHLPTHLGQRWLDAADWLDWPLRHRETFAAGESPSIFWLQRGMVKIGRFLPGGKEDYQYLVQAGSWIGELTLVEPDYPAFFAMAARPSQVLRLPSRLVQKGMMSHPSFNLLVLEQLGIRLREMQARREAMIHQSARARILAFLCDYCQRFGQLHGEVIEVSQPLSHTDISKFTATSRQSVHTLMAELRRDGWLDYNQRELRVPKEHLRRLRREVQG